MIADDELVIVEGAKAVVEMLGHEMLYTASDGVEALDTLKKHAASLDVIFIDFRMPLMYGDETVRHFRKWEALERPEAPPLLIFACTGDVAASAIGNLSGCGFNGTLLKPLYPRTYKEILSLDPQRIQAVIL